MRKLLVVLIMWLSVVPAVEARSFAEKRIHKIIQMEKIKEYTSEDIKWLAYNIYFEARNQSLHGRMVVGFVTLNRVVSTKFPDGIREVVTQPEQFSWYNKYKYNEAPIIDTRNSIERTAWEECLQTANLCIDLYNSMAESQDWDVDGITKGADHYFASYIAPPRWASKMEYIGKVGEHLLYKS